MPIHKVSKDLVLNYTIHQPRTTKAVPADSQSKPYIVLINGMTDASSTWDLQVAALTAAGYPVLTFDNRGIGPLSSTPPGPYSADIMASDLKSLIKGLEIPKPFHLLGVSMGGMIAQSYALKWSEDLIGVVFGCTYAAPGGFNNRLLDGWGRTAQVMGLKEVVGEVMLWCFTPDFYNAPESNDFVEEGIKEASSRMTTEGFLAQLAAVKGFDSSDTIKKLGVKYGKPKVCVLAGQEDILIPVSKSRELHELVPGSEWVTTKGGHGCMWEFADEFNSNVLAFFERAEKDDQ